MPGMLLALAAAAFVLAWVLLRLLLTRYAHLALDRPNERSLHERPVPRTGGIAILLGAAVALAAGAAAQWLLLVLTLVLAVLSMLDDLRSLPAWLRLAAHLACAVVLVWYLMSPMHPLEIALLALALAWITNLYNFMDGSDGLAGGMALIGFGTYALAAWLANDATVAALALALAAAAAAFLAFNFPPARIFLGDVGSIPLGFLAGGVGILGWRNDLWPLWFPLVVFAVFIGDASVTLLRRLARRERVWQAHRDHYYQRLVRSGFGHRGTALVAYGAMLVCAAAALAARAQPWGRAAWAWLFTLVVLTATALWIDARWARHRREGGA
jgi:UDP-N-acetylmuramyl pentapeptide phosphotransferase/UDP-N-acetylglucosamine-1-phosphate transferase